MNLQFEKSFYKLLVKILVLKQNCIGQIAHCEGTEKASYDIFLNSTINRVERLFVSTIKIVAKSRVEYDTHELEILKDLDIGFFKKTQSITNIHWTTHFREQQIISIHEKLSHPTVAQKIDGTKLPNHHRPACKQFSQANECNEFARMSTANPFA